MTKFNFDNTKKPNESKELNDVNHVEAPQDTAQLTDDTSKQSENHNEAGKESKAEEPKKSNTVVVSYIGNGTWTDSSHKHWSRSAREDVGILSTRSYSKEEYNNRKDLQFMVSYGEMKIVEV